jgi:ketosteroid isomerase-like protein
MAADFKPEYAVDVVSRYTDAVNAADRTAMARFLTDDYVQWHAHICRNFTWEEESRLLEQLMSSAKLTCHDVRLTPAKEGVIKRYNISLQGPEGWLARSVPALVLFRFRGNSIYRAEEFFDALSTDVSGLPEPCAIGEVRGQLDPAGERSQADIDPSDWNIPLARQVEREFTRALEAGDSTSLLGLMSETSDTWFNTSQYHLNKLELGDRMGKYRRFIRNRSFRDIQVLYHPDGFLWEATLAGETDQGPVTIPFVAVADIENEQIVRTEVYLNGASLPAQE